MLYYEGVQPVISLDFHPHRVSGSYAQDWVNMTNHSTGKLPSIQQLWSRGLSDSAVFFYRAPCPSHFLSPASWRCSDEWIECPLNPTGTPCSSQNDLLIRHTATSLHRKIGRRSLQKSPVCTGPHLSLFCHGGEKKKKQKKRYSCGFLW